MRQIDRRIPADATSILELGVADGRNLTYLARRHPEFEFCGVDPFAGNLRRAKRHASSVENIQLRQSNSSNLPFSSGTFDLLYTVGGAGRTTEVAQTLAEAGRVLRVGGRLVVLDRWRSARFSQLSTVCQHAAELAEQAMASDRGWVFPQWLAVAQEHGFRLMEDLDLSSVLMPHLRCLERAAMRYLRHRLILRMSRRIIPTGLAMATVAGCLMPITVDSGAHTYRLVTLLRH